jgi:hypothetical protein
MVQLITEVMEEFCCKAGCHIIKKGSFGENSQLHSYVVKHMHHSLPMLLIEYVVIGFVAPIFCN